MLVGFAKVWSFLRLNVTVLQRVYEIGFDQACRDSCTNYKN